MSIGFFFFFDSGLWYLMQAGATLSADGRLDALILVIVDGARAEGKAS